MATFPHPALGGASAWFIWSLGALSFGYGFFQRVAPSVMVQDLMREFTVGAAVLGNLSAIYFYLYAALQLPIGILVDRWGPRVMITGAMLLAAAGSLVFGLAGTIEAAYLGRAMIGAGSCVSFVATLILASRWFAPNRFAFLSGLTMLVAMASAVGSQAPLAAVVDAAGWRITMLAGAGAALIIAMLIALCARDRPPGSRPHQDHGRHNWRDLAGALLRVVKIPQVWNAALLSATMTSAMLSFGGLWGVPYLMARYGMARPEAAFVCSFFFIGWAFGAPCGGWLSDRIGRRKGPLVAAALINCAALSILILGPEMSAGATAAAITAAGMAGGVMITCYAYAREITEPSIEGAVTGFINSFTVGSGALFQPLIGLLLDLNWSGTLAEAGRVYSVEAYSLALSSLIVAAAIAVISALMLKETWCQRGAGVIVRQESSGTG